MTHIVLAGDMAPTGIRLVTPGLKERELSHRSRSLDHEMKESQGERKLHLGDKEEGQSESMKRKEPAP